ncbi:MAG: 2-oxoacid:acceptor oxidoreductase subunit alpha [Deltaproteobacteria bacterium]|nr:2-oxoacid:acceptor oxidoreductase subunit alpha [Deltaproteobacteria bacterium]
MKDLNIVIVGAAGEGIQSVGGIFAEAVSALGYAVFSWKEYESRIRGGVNRFAIRIGGKPANAPLEKADILLALNDKAFAKYKYLLKKDGVLVSGENADERTITIDFKKTAREAFDDTIYANIVAVGALAGILGMNLDHLKHVVAKKFKSKPKKVIENNRSAAAKGYEMAEKSCREQCPWELPPRDETYTLIAGNEMLPIAAAHGGCRFIAAYPMSPSTGIITTLAHHSAQWGVFAEQAEDEIAAINMAIGASYAGARSMTATSGGGFALMVEGISLAGMTETPVVIVLAQRPGPATGLPTRTSQGDLLFAIHAGHGEFPKLVMAPSDPEDIFKKTVRAFNLADHFQIPVIILTDQFLADSRFSVEDVKSIFSKAKSHLADASEITDYKRYALTENGISPRLYPGQSDHLVAADSDEHDEYGHITEELSGTAPAMVEKRRTKMDGLKSVVEPPEQYRVETADVILVGWGSSRGAIIEALEALEKDEIKAGMIHFTELWPLPEMKWPEGKSYWLVEANATGQLGRVLKSEYAVSFQGHVLKYDGLPLHAEDIRRQIHDGFRKK